MSEDLERAQAVERLKARRDFGWHLVTYLVINGLLAFVWSIHGGFYWPAWVAVAWGIGLAFHAWYAFLGGPISEKDIRREMQRHRVRPSDPGPPPQVSG